MERAIKETANNQRLILILAISYSARREIINTVNRLLDAGVKHVDEKLFESYLDTAGLPDPDLLIRTSGEFRLSNFLLYQVAYSEILVTEKYWPDFQRKDLYESILYYQQRERRFGKTSEQVVK
jgi:undecaprenyl diphosphate synthase